MNGKFECNFRAPHSYDGKNSKNEAARRKRTGYQSGFKSDLYLGGHVVSPQTPLPRAYLTASGWGIQKSIIKHPIAERIFYVNIKMRY